MPTCSHNICPANLSPSKEIQLLYRQYNTYYQEAIQHVLAEWALDITAQMAVKMTQITSQLFKKRHFHDSQLNKT